MWHSPDVTINRGWEISHDSVQRLLPIVTNNFSWTLVQTSWPIQHSQSAEALLRSKSAWNLITQTSHIRQSFFRTMETNRLRENAARRVKACSQGLKSPRSRRREIVMIQGYQEEGVSETEKGVRDTGRRRKCGMWVRLRLGVAVWTAVVSASPRYFGLPIWKCYLQNTHAHLITPLPLSRWTHNSGILCRFCKAGRILI